MLGTAVASRSVRVHNDAVNEPVGLIETFGLVAHVVYTLSHACCAVTVPWAGSTEAWTSCLPAQPASTMRWVIPAMIVVYKACSGQLDGGMAPRTLYLR